MSFRERNIGGGDRECEESKSVRQNGSLTTTQLTIDENLLVDPKLLFIGSKIGEGAHGKVYEGRSVVKVLDVSSIVFPALIFLEFFVFVLFLAANSCEP